MKAQTEDTPPKGDANHHAVAISLIFFTLIGIVACSGYVLADWWTCLPDDVNRTYVGRQSCIQCHAAQGRSFAGSHHDLAMDKATPETVLGDFSDVELSHFGIKSRMYRKQDRYMVRTEGPDGKLADFEVKYVLGVEPLQQYMVEFDRPNEMPGNEIARLQVLRISWDTEKKRWFYLSPPDVDESVDPLSPEDDLHWTGITQCWNTTCADCHSTDLKKNFDPGAKTYHTTFSEIDVSCEACHGPGSVHVELANSKSLFWDRKHGYGLAKLKDENTKIEIESCAPCHSHRQVIQSEYAAGEPYHDFYRNALLHGHLYHADGQIHEEVYVYGSFTQSKMYEKGIRCTDCHDPHTTKLKHEGNKLCTSCHQHPPAKYDSPAHHHHKPGSKGALCVECHMPTKTYMAVDSRRDHSLRIPRPDLSVELGTPNACSRCHLSEDQIKVESTAKLKQYSDWLDAADDDAIQQAIDQLDKRMADKAVQWYGDMFKSREHFAKAFELARQGDPAAQPMLHKIAKDRKAAPIVKATALFHLGSSDSQESLNIAIASLRDIDPQVRASALARIDTEISIQRDRFAMGAASHLEKSFKPLVDPLLSRLTDESRLVRTEAARVIAGIPANAFIALTTESQRDVFSDAIDEFKAGLMYNNDRATSYSVIGSLNELVGDTDKAVHAYRMAIKVEPGVAGPRRNLAAILDHRRQETEQQLRQLAINRAMEKSDRDAEIDALIKKATKYQFEMAKLRREELALLGRDARLAPQVAAIQYQYGLFLHLHGEKDKAEQQLVKAQQLEPNMPQYAYVLAIFYKDQARWKKALDYAEKAKSIVPRDPSYNRLVQEIKVELSKPPGPQP